jgi:hypothetical protein
VPYRQLILSAAPLIRYPRARDTSDTNRALSLSCSAHMAESCWRAKVRREKDFDPEDGLLEGGVEEEGEEEGVWAWEGDGVECDINVVLESDGEEV